MRFRNGNIAMLKAFFLYFLLILFCLSSTIRATTNNSPVSNLLLKYFYNDTKTGKYTHIKELKNALNNYQETRIKGQICKKIGDVYYDLKKIRKMLKWYEYAVQYYPAIGDPYKTPLAFRMTRSRKQILRQNFFIVIYMIFFGLLFILIYRIYTSKGFDRKEFIKRFRLYAVILIFGLVLLLVIDSLTHISLSEKISENEAVPVIIYNLIHIRPFKQFIEICIVCLIPILFSTLYTSVRKKYSPVRLTILLSILWLVLWGHFSLRNVFNEYLDSFGFIKNNRLMIRGELEDELYINPEKLLKEAEWNPNLTEIIDAYIEESDEE